MLRVSRREDRAGLDGEDGQEPDASLSAPLVKCPHCGEEISVGGGTPTEPEPLIAASEH
jgi:hypothetical protein